MGQQVCMGALLQCNFGAAPVPLTVLPADKVFIGPLPAATIMDNKPIMSIATFGLCTSSSNPAVIAAKAVGSPGAPCIPVLAAPWAAGSPTVLIGGKPALNDASKLVCLMGGTIEIKNPGQSGVQIP